MTTWWAKVFRANQCQRLQAYVGGDFLIGDDAQIAGELRLINVGPRRRSEPEQGNQGQQRRASPARKTGLGADLPRAR